MKLGLKYQEIGHGDKDLWPVINNGNWNQARYFFTSFNSYFQQIGIPGDDFSTVSTFFRYTDDGLLICLAQRMAVRGGSGTSNSSASFWIYVPYNMAISPDELIRTIDEVKGLLHENAVFSGNASNFNNAIPAIFNKEFGQNPDAKRPDAMTSQQLGIVYLSTDFTEKKLWWFGYQPEYSKYDFIYVSSNKINNPTLPVVDTSDFKKAIRILPPTGSTVPGAIKIGGIVSVLVDNKPMKAEGLLIDPGMHYVTLKHQGLEPIEADVMITDEMGGKPMDLRNALANKEWMKKLDLSHLKVQFNGMEVSETPIRIKSDSTFDSKGRHKREFDIKDNDIFVPFSKINNVSFEIVVKGYVVEYLNDIDLTDPQALMRTVNLKAQPFVATAGYKGEKITIHASGPESKKLMSKGFHYQDGEVREIKTSWHEKGFWGLVILILLALILFLILDWTIDTGNNKTQEDITQVQQITEPKEESVEATIEETDENSNEDTGSKDEVPQCLDDEESNNNLPNNQLIQKTEPNAGVNQRPIGGNTSTPKSIPEKLD